MNVNLAKQKKKRRSNRVMNKLEILVVAIVTALIALLAWFTFYGNQEIMLIIYTALAVVCAIRVYREIKEQ